MGFNVDGIDKLKGALTALSNSDFADHALRKGLTKAGKQVQATAKKLCPVDTGQLRNSIEVTQIENGVDIGTNVEYAPYVEFGTGQRGDSSVAHRHDWDGMAPRPFLHPALQANKKNVVKIVQDTLQKEIDKVVK